VIRAYEFPSKGLYATVKLLRSGDGYVAETWWTMASEAVPRVVAHIDVPVFGTAEQAVKSVAPVIHTLSEVVPTLWNGEGTPALEAPSSYHVDAHLKWHGDRLETLGLDAVEDVAAMYRLLSEFRVKNPAERIRAYLGIESVRTVHEYIADARAKGLIPKYGKGRSYV
jgi:hypothetical protein